MLHQTPKHGSDRAPQRIDHGVTRSSGRQRLTFSSWLARRTAAMLVGAATVAGFGWTTALWSAAPNTTAAGQPAATSKSKQPAANPKTKQPAAGARPKQAAASPRPKQPVASPKPQQPVAGLDNRQAPLTRRQAAKAARAPHEDGELAAIMARLNAGATRSNPSSGSRQGGNSDLSAEPARLTELPPVTDSDLEALQNKIQRVLTIYFPKHQNTRDNSAWEVMHEIIAYGVDSQLFRDGPYGPKVNAIGWLCYNGSCKGEQMLYLDRGQIVARKGPGVQGHYGQFLAILAQSRLPSDYPMLISGKTFTIADLVEHEKMDCQPGEELTFKLIGLMHYLDSDATWTSRYGEPWSITRLITEELKQPIRGAACGGTHRLMGFSYAVNKRVHRGKEVTGEFARARKFINEYHRYTFSLQNADGSFSTQWFTRREADPDVGRRLRTTGHIAEWLSFSLSDDDVRSPQMVKAVDYLATILLSDSGRKWDIGPLGHGLHALALYDSRLSAAQEQQQPAAAPLVTRLPAVSDEPIDTGLSFLREDEDIVADDPAARAAHQPCPARMTQAKTPAGEACELPLWEAPRCQIGNEQEELVAPDSAIKPGDADDEICL